MNNENNTDNLRRAIGLMLEESAPAAGWEQRVLDDVSAVQPSRRKRLRVWLTAASTAVAAAVLVLVTLLKPQPAIAPVFIEIVEFQLFMAQAPAPVEHVAPQAPQPAPQLAAAAPVVILPKPLDEPDSEYAIDYSIGAEYIDELLAQCLAEEDEILATILDPDFNASFIPLQ